MAALCGYLRCILWLKLGIIKQNNRHVRSADLVARGFRSTGGCCGSMNIEGAGGHNLSALPPFTANAYNELYAFYMEKGGSLQKYEPIEGGTTSPFAAATYRPGNF